MLIIVCNSVSTEKIKRMAEQSYGITFMNVYEHVLREIEGCCIALLIQSTDVTQTMSSIMLNDRRRTNKC